MENQVKPVVPAVQPAKAVKTEISPERFVEVGEELKQGLISLPKDYDVRAAMYSMYTKCVSNEAGNLLAICRPDSVKEAIKTVLINAWNPDLGHCCFYPATYNDKSPYAGQKYLAVQKMVKGGVSSAYNSGNIVKNSMLAQVIYEGDAFESKILNDGRTIIVKHERPSFDKWSDEVAGAYVVFKIIIGGKQLFDAEIMTKQQIDNAWLQGKPQNIDNRKRFPEEFAKRTVKGRAAKRVCGWTQEQLNAFYENGEATIDDINAITIKPIDKQPTDEVYDIDLTDGAEKEE